MCFTGRVLGYANPTVGQGRKRLIVCLGDRELYRFQLTKPARNVKSEERTLQINKQEGQAIKGRKAGHGSPKCGETRIPRGLGAEVTNLGPQPAEEAKAQATDY